MLEKLINVKEFLQNFIQNKDKCGFGSYIVTKKEPYLRVMALDEGKIDTNTNYKKAIRDAILEAINDKFLAAEAEYISGSNVANEQDKFYIIDQGEDYKPFEFLNTDVSSIPYFKHAEVEDATGIIFWFRYADKEFWAYQHLWSIMIPNKKKSNLLTKIQHFENYDFFVEQKEPLLTIANKVDLLIINNSIITSNVKLMQKSFDFEDFIVATANKSIKKIANKQLVANPEKLKEYIERGKTSKYAKKMMRIANSKVLDLDKDTLMKKINSLDRWKDKFDKDEEDNIILNSFKQVEDLIDLLDERWTRSDVTNQEYDTDVKRVVEPAN